MIPVAETLEPQLWERPVKSAPSKFNILAAVLLAGVLPWLVSLSSHLLLGDTQHVQERLHEFLELIGACIALGVALLLLLRAKHEQVGPHLLWAASALVAMGLMDCAHGVAPFGVAWSWLRHGATLVGGLLFGFVWLPLPAVAIRRNRFSILMAAGMALTAVLVVWWQTDWLPAPFGPDGYTFAAKATNALGGLGFLAAALFFCRRYLREPRPDDLVFASHTLLFGTASLLFGFSHLWAADWWVWHGARLLAYSVVLVAAYRVVVGAYQESGLRAQELEQVNRALLVQNAERQRAEAAVQEERQRFQRVLDQLPAYLVLLTPDYHVPFANRFFEERFGKSEGRRCFEYLFNRTEPCEICDTYAVLKTNSPQRWEWTGPDHHNYDIFDFPFTDEDGSPLIMEVGLDITERKQAEEAVRESEERYRSLVQATAQIDWTTDSAGQLRTDMPRWRAFTGQSFEQVEGANWLDAVHPDDRMRVAAVWQRAVAERSFYEVEYRIRRHDGVYRDFWVRGIPVLTADGRIREWVGACTDITERKRAEQAIHRYAEELRRSNQELEHFAYVASHDLQEPLRTVSSFSQLLARRYKGKLDNEADEFITFIVEGAMRMQTLINDLLAFSRIGTRGEPFAPLDCEGILQAAKENLDAAIAESRAVVTHDRLPTLSADPTQLTQLFQNLLANAIRFRRPEEPPRIHVSAARQDGAWRVSVRDNGIGIDPQYFDRIFIIFQRLHGRDEYPGTGIGLALCKKIVERHGGSISVESEPGKGSTFHFTIPDERTT